MATRNRKPEDLHKEDIDWIKKEKLLNKSDYTEWDGPTLTAVYCKRCGTKICGLIPGDAEPRVVKVGNRIIEQRLMRFSALPMYAEVEIICDDGSKHVSACCKECAPFLTEDQLDAFLIADTEAEIKQSAKAGGRVSERLLEQRVMRRLKRKEKK